MKKLQFKIHLWSKMKMPQDYAPTLHGPFNSRDEANTFARQNLKLEENLTGKKKFEVRPV